jgi:hypothetical protein
MKLRAVLRVCGLLLVAACDEVPQASEVPTPTEAQMSAAEAQAETARPTVCVAYDAELARAKAAGDAAQVSTLEAIIADACN